MEKFSYVFIPLLLALFLVRLIVIPMRTVFHIGIHAGSGLICLWLLNTVSVFTGVLFPVNAVTLAVAGFFGLPGIAALAFLSCMT